MKNVSRRKGVLLNPANLFSNDETFNNIAREFKNKLKDEGKAASEIRRQIHRYRKTYEKNL